MRKRIIIFSLLALLIVIFFIQNLYSADPISGKVIDASTGMPVAGAVIVARWHSRSPGFHSPNRKLFVIEETLTDAAGKYKVPGWQYKFLDRILGSVDIKEPELLVYKYGYGPKIIRNKYPQGIYRNKDTHGTIIHWNSTADVAIDRLTGSTDQQLKQFDSYDITPSIASVCELGKPVFLLLEVDKQLEDRESYYADLYKDNKNSPDNAKTLWTPWYMREHYPASAECIKIINDLKKARKIRGKGIDNEVH